MYRKTEHTKATVTSLNGRIDKVHNKLAGAITEESRERKDTQAKVDEAIEAMTKRLTKLETTDYKHDLNHSDDPARKDNEHHLGRLERKPPAGGDRGHRE